MAIYKPTFCYPFLNNIDIRVVNNSSTTAMAEWLKCKIDTSNKNITGYRIKIFDNNNNQIFPFNNEEGQISPIEEISNIGPENAELDSNSGENGSFLYIPFFQNNALKIVNSYNAVYYTANYYADYYIPITERGNWYEENIYYLRNNSWDGTLNGDFCSLGEYVCVQKEENGNNVYYLYQIKDNRTLERIKRIEDGTILIIKKGSYHNSSFSNRDALDKAKIIDCNGNTINFSFDISSYKWTIQLYQGQYDANSGLESNPKYITYENLDNNWYDAILGSGTILGSTSKRIQIANEMQNGWTIPNASINNPLVLQGKWIELLDEYGNTIKNRAYVQNYDLSLGHVYPRDGYFTSQDIEKATKAVFYNLSNNPSEILDSDMVACASVGNLPIYTTDESGSIILNPDHNITSIDGWQLSVGERVLIKNQTNPEQNGIYTFNGEDTAWSRSGGAETWGSLIGKKVYVQNGSEGAGKNFQSQAFAGGSLLFASNSSTNASGSPLYWIIEQPILLYDTEVKNVQFFYLSSQNITGKTSIDNIPLEIGDLIYYIHITRQVPTIRFEGLLCTYTGQGNFSTESLIRNNYYKVEKGQQKDNIYKYSNNYSQAVEPSYDFSQADILKNTPGFAFISPFIDLQKGQKLKLTNALVGNKQTPWIQIKDIERTIWRIKYDYERETGESLIVFPSEDISGINSNIPYKYEIRTFFNQSEENPFNINEAPYLNIARITQNDENNPDIFPLIEDRYITLRGTYKQFQEASWESYRWVLVNHNGEIIQDSGKKYDREIKVLFYGLNNDQEEDHNKYTIILYVEDNLGHVLTKNINIEVVYPLGDITDVQLIGQYDCDTQSIVLNIEDPNGELGSETPIAIYRREKANYIRGEYNPTTHSFQEETSFTGDWHPVYVNGTDRTIRDFNIKANYSYQYILYALSSRDSSLWMFNQTIELSEELSYYNIVFTSNDVTYSQMMSNIVLDYGYAEIYSTDTGWIDDDYRTIRILTPESNWSSSFKNFLERNAQRIDSNLNITSFATKEIKTEAEQIQGDIYTVDSQFWSLVELQPIEEKNKTIPVIQKQFKADLDNVWIFKYDTDLGSQAQNFSKNEINSLGIYPKVGFGIKNYISGDISCLLGDEIILYSKEGYVERLTNGINRPLSSNEKIRMLEQWKKMAFSRNPKLLRDNKGQSWIVQIFTSSNTPYSLYVNQPDKISFSWKQINSTEDCLIYGSGEVLDKKGCQPIWEKNSENNSEQVVLTIMVKDHIEQIEVIVSNSGHNMTYKFGKGNHKILVNKGSSIYWTISPDLGYISEPSSGHIYQISSDSSISDYIVDKQTQVFITAGTGIADAFLSTDAQGNSRYPSGQPFPSGTTVYGFVITSEYYEYEGGTGKIQIGSVQLQTNDYDFGTINASRRIKQIQFTFPTDEHDDPVWPAGINFINLTYYDENERQRTIGLTEEDAPWTYEAAMGYLYSWEIIGDETNYNFNRTMGSSILVNNNTIYLYSDRKTYNISFTVNPNKPYGGWNVSSTIANSGDRLITVQSTDEIMVRCHKWDDPSAARWVAYFTKDSSTERYSYVLDDINVQTPVYSDQEIVGGAIPEVWILPPENLSGRSRELITPLEGSTYLCTWGFSNPNDFEVTFNYEISWLGGGIQPVTGTGTVAANSTASFSQSTDTLPVMGRVYFSKEIPAGGGINRTSESKYYKISRIRNNNMVEIY